MSDVIEKSFVRGADIVIATFLLLVTFPLLAVGMVVAKLCFGSALFFQTRIGQNQRPFTIFKLRTMYRWVPSLPTHQLPSGATNVIGRLMRRARIDELPQLFNVLIGSMSLVGPRPCLADMHELITLRADAGLYHLKPGLTGIAQLRGVGMADAPLLVLVEQEYFKRCFPVLYFNNLFVTTTKLFTNAK